MPRKKLKKARELAGYTQEQFAEITGVSPTTVTKWETEDRTIRPCYIKPIKELLGNDPHLFDIERADEREPVAVETRETGPLALPQPDTGLTVQEPCHSETNRGILDSSVPTSIIIRIPGSVRGIREFMDIVRRQFMEFVGKVSGGALFSGLTLGLVPSATVDPEEYLSLVEASIGTWWQWFHQGNNTKLDRVLSENIPILKRLAYTMSPSQKMAASLAVEAKIIQIRRATANLQFSKRESYCGDLVNFGELSGDRNLHAAALYWHGDTYTYCYHQPQTAIDVFDDALSVLQSESPLIRSKICSNLSIAYAQLGNEREAMNYAEIARVTMPEHPEFDPSYQYGRCGHAELDQFEGRTRLYLADSLSSRIYARQAHEAFNESTSKQSANRGMLAQAYLRKADAARALGDMRECVECITQGVDIATERDSLDRLAYAHKIIERVLSEWKQETAIQALDKRISRALVVARR